MGAAISNQLSPGEMCALRKVWAKKEQIKIIAWQSGDAARGVPRYEKTSEDGRRYTRVLNQLLDSVHPHAVKLDVECEWDGVDLAGRKACNFVLPGGAYDVLVRARRGKQKRRVERLRVVAATPRLPRRSVASRRDR